MTVSLRGAREIADRLRGWQEQFRVEDRVSLSCDPGWLPVLSRGLKQRPYCVEAVEQGRTVGLLPLLYLKSTLFGRFLVSLPYLNVGGVRAANETVATNLISRAVELADELDVRYLELRHETEHAHPALGGKLTSKVHMRLPLPASEDVLWDRLNSKVRNQIRKGEKQQFSVQWGRLNRLRDFYAVFSHNMRDLGTPVFSRALFANVLEAFSDSAELCVVKLDGRPVAAALLTHGTEITEVPSASSLREFNATNANMFMYWQLLKRSIERNQSTFDFGRSSEDSSTYRFKKQWGAVPHPAVWQYYVRRGSVGDMRREAGGYDKMIRWWRRLPVWVTRLIGPPIVRGIP